MKSADIVCTALLVHLKDPLQRQFYAEMTRVERFYHRCLRRMMAIELKLGSFDAAYKGQMELYLRWLDRYERRAGRGDPHRPDFMRREEPGADAIARPRRDQVVRVSGGVASQGDAGS